ncbi:hypothetical protein CROQUDRAFT_92501 [Cronartium quercuum f. sp. fusiforme G11]|uniref:RNase H type-1 domain-containing protein n=1 Tax=Cronartium quercuum f. sp. fusiforme G11 TaxID=708437 RepID=A0A9P6NGJ7_9BASI|nr:hypothetical protein CROQUDRAFT_92501 [Cronartium quercuum f. sp. fusiforme G11]
MLYGSIVRFLNDTYKGSVKMWKTIQNVAFWLILGAFHELLKRELNVNPPSHKSPIHLLLQKNFLDTLYPRQYEVVKPSPCPPWTRQAGVIHNLELKWEEAIEKVTSQIEEEKLKGTMLLSTDGSAIPQVGCVAAVVSDTMIRQGSLGRADELSNFEAEIMGLSMALNQTSNSLVTDPFTFEGVSIFCDNQSAIQLVNNPPRSIFFWTPGHESIELSELADKAAREAAEEQDEPLILNSSLGSLLQRIRAHFHIRQYRFDPGRAQFKISPKKIVDALSFLEKWQRGRNIPTTIQSQPAQYESA